MKVLVLLAALVANSLAAPSDCDNSFGGFLNALKDEIQGNVASLEQEYRDDFYKLVRQCFASSTDDSSKCALTDDEVKGDVYGDGGPLKGCDKCQRMVKGFREKFMGSQESVRKCFREHFGEAVRQELEPCIQGKINDYNFKTPKIPDFDANAFGQISVIEAGIDYRIAASSRLEACQAVNPAKYGNTKPCMDKEFSGIFTKHCDATKKAKAKAVISGCTSRFDSVRKATCQCMDEKREDWHQRFAKIQTIVNSATAAKQCGDDIEAVLGNWLDKLQNTMKDCLPKEGNDEKRDLKMLIQLGCGQVINGGIKKNEMTLGFRFIRLFLDALNDRLTIYCDKNCNA